LLDVLEVAKPDRAHHMRDMDSNVDRMKGWLARHIGPDWATATRRNTNSRLGITRGVLPWVEMQRANTKTGGDAVPAFVERHVRHLTNNFYTFNP